MTTHQTNAAEACFNTVLINTTLGIEPNPITAEITLRPTYPQGNVPTITLGSFVVLQSAHECIQAGMVTHVKESASSLEFEIDVWPLAEPAGEFRPHGQRVNGLICVPGTYVVDGTCDEDTFVGYLQKLSPAEAARLRTQIAHSVPANVLEVFWTQDARRALEADRAEVARYERAAQSLIESL